MHREGCEAASPPGLRSSVKPKAMPLSLLVPVSLICPRSRHWERTGVLSQSFVSVLALELYLSPFLLLPWQCWLSCSSWIIPAWLMTVVFYVLHVLFIVLQLPECLGLLNVPFRLFLSNNPGRVDVVGLNYTAESWT